MVDGKGKIENEVSGGLDPKKIRQNKLTRTSFNECGTSHVKEDSLVLYKCAALVA